MRSSTGQFRPTILCALALCVVLIAAGCAQQDQPAYGPAREGALLFEDPIEELLKSEGETVSADSADRIARLAELLGLDEEQTAALTESYSDFRAEMQGIRSEFQDGAISREEARPLVVAAREALEAELQLILSSEQYDQLQEMRQNRNGRHAGRRGLTERWEAWLTDIGADADQSEAVLAAVGVLKEGMSEIRDQVHAGDMTRADAAPLAMALRETFRAALGEILTPEQLEALFALRPDCSHRRR